MFQCQPGPQQTQTGQLQESVRQQGVITVHMPSHAHYQVWTECLRAQRHAVCTAVDRVFLGMPTTTQRKASACAKRTSVLTFALNGQKYTIHSWMHFLCHLLLRTRG